MSDTPVLLQGPPAARLDVTAVSDLAQTSVPLPGAPFDITEGHAGDRIASNGSHSLHLLDAGGRVFRRRAVKGLGSGEARLVEWAVAELHGVRVYFDGAQVVVTTRDITP